jgi:hypothetical protein
MTNPVQPSVTLTVPDPVKGGEIDFELVFDFEAIAHAEDVTGLSLLTGMTRKIVEHPTISLVRAMLFAALLATEPKITLSEASAFVTRKTFKLIWAKVLDAWVIGMNDEEETPADPPQSQS